MQNKPSTYVCPVQLSSIRDLTAYTSNPIILSNGTAVPFLNSDMASQAANMDPLTTCHSSDYLLSSIFRYRFILLMNLTTPQVVGRRTRHPTGVEQIRAMQMSKFRRVLDSISFEDVFCPPFPQIFQLLVRFAPAPHQVNNPRLYTSEVTCTFQIPAQGICC